MRSLCTMKIVSLWPTSWFIRSLPENTCNLCCLLWEINGQHPKVDNLIETWEGFCLCRIQVSSIPLLLNTPRDVLSVKVNHLRIHWEKKEKYVWLQVWYTRMIHALLCSCIASAQPVYQLVYFLHLCLLWAPFVLRAQPMKSVFLWIERSIQRDKSISGESWIWWQQLNKWSKCRLHLKHKK